MYHILAGPEFNSPDRRPTSSLGILGATQKQAVCVIKARLPEDALETRKLAAVGKPEDRLTDYVCGVEHTDPAIMDVLPNELVFRVQTTPVSEVNMQSFVAEHPVYGKQYLTGDIQVEAFSALNGLPADEYKLVFVGVATGSQIQKRGIDGFAVQVSGSVTINNPNNRLDFVCAGDWVVWTLPTCVGGVPRFTVIGIPRTKALAELTTVTAIEIVNSDFVDADTGDFNQTVHEFVIGRALTSATQCQEFDLMLHS